MIIVLAISTRRDEAKIRKCPALQQTAEMHCHRSTQRLRFHYLSVFGGNRVSLLALSDRVRGSVAKTRVGGRGSAKRGAIMEVFC